MSDGNSNSSNSSGSKKKKNRTSGSRGSLLNNLAFYAVIFLAIVMVINAFLAILAKCGVSADSMRSGVNILMKVALAIAIIITVIASYHAARGKGKKMFTLWIVSAILVVLSYVLGITLI